MNGLRNVILLMTMANGTFAWAVFVDVTLESGIDHVQWTPQPGQSYSEPYMMSGGAAAGDFDNDGWVDLFVTRIGAPDILYRNRGDGTFVDVSAQAGFQMAADTNGAVWGDIDNDGDADLYVTGIETDQHFLYVNDGQGRFVEQAATRGASLPSTHRRRGYSATFGDFDRDGYLDLHTTEWGSFPGHDGEIVTVSRLLRNQGSAAPGHFEDVTETAGVSLTDVQGQNRHQPVNGVFSFSSQFTDLDRDGWSDLVVAGDFGTSRLFWNNRDGTFTDGTASAGVGGDENGMGSAVGDYDGDGDLDWFVTSVYDANDTCGTPPPGQFCTWGASGNRLYRNDGNRQFSDQTDAAAVRDGGWGWGTSFLDYDLDGDLDLAMTNGMRMPLSTLDDAFNDDPLRLWQNEGVGAPFRERAMELGLTDQGSGKGLLTLDYDQDGDLDLFIVNNAGSPILYRNEQSGNGQWIAVDAVGTLSNRDGLGTKVTIDPDLSVVGDEQFREVHAGSNFLGQNERAAFFGLGDEPVIIDRIRLEWPSGYFQNIYDVASNQRLTVVERVPEPAGLLLPGWLLAGWLFRRRVTASSKCGGNSRRPRG